jgi:hypothetical protein
MSRTLFRIAAVTRSKVVTVLVAVGLLTVGLAGVAQAATPAASPCNDSGSADGCVHLNMNNGARYAWYHYGYHNVTVSGVGVLINSQTGGAVAYYCTRTDGDGTCKLVKAGNAVVGDFSDIKSIYMSAKPTS